MMPRMGEPPNELTVLDFAKIIARRDPRYDGRFLFGVRTTRIYCRVTCPARPKPENIVIFRSHSEAERSGYRPCLRCRPDAAPGSRVHLGTSNTVGRALRIIDDEHENRSVDELAQVLGVTDRHLRRLFDEHLGASPIEIMTTKRLHLARRLISETDKPFSEIAFAVGFQSIRRFNSAFKNLFDRTPSQIRANQKIATCSDTLELSLVVRAPYDWSTVLGYLKRHETYGVESVTTEAYNRYVASNTSADRIGRIRVSQSSRPHQIRVQLTSIPLIEIRPILSRLRFLFDTDHNPSHLPSRSHLKPRGIRVPGCFDPFETAVSIILSQLVSTTQAKATLKNLVLRYGEFAGSFETDEVFRFPTALKLMNAPLEELGLTKIKAGAIRELSRQVAKKELDLNANADIETTRKMLLSIKGIGPWTSEMVAMRCLGDSNAYPKGDLIIQRAIAAGLATESEWSSSRAYLTHSVWRDYASILVKTNQTKARHKKAST